MRKSKSIAIGVLCAAALAFAADKAKRPFDIDDIFRQEIVYPTPSPDGSFVAYSRSLPMPEQMKRFGNFRAIRSRCDAWIYNTATGKRTTLFTSGDEGWAVASFFWWSPDSRFLAMEIAAGAKRRIYMWDRTTGLKYPVSDTFVERSEGTAAASNTTRKWASPAQFVAVIPPPPPSPVDPKYGSYIQPLLQGLLDHENNRPSVNVMDSVPSVDDKSPRGQVIVCDAVTKTSKVVFAGTADLLTESPDGKRMAFLAIGPTLRPDPNTRFPASSNDRNFETSRITIADWNDGNRVSTVAGADHVFMNSLGWSNDGTRLSFLARSEAGRGASDLFVYTAADRKLVKARLGDTQTPARQGGDFRWIGPHRLLVFTGAAGKPKHWSEVADDGTKRELPSAKPLPAQIFENSKDANGFVFLDAGNISRYDLAKQSAACVTCESPVKLANITWSSGEALIGSVKEGASTNYYLHRFGENKIQPLTLPENPYYLFFQVDPKTGSSILMTGDETHTNIWAANLFDGKHEIVAKADNSYIDEIYRGDPQFISYRSTDGQPLTAILMLPIGHEPGKRYPMIVSGYPGTVLSARNPNNSINSYPNSFLEFVAHGYAVLEVSMPLPRRIPNDNYLEMLKGVLPAVDKVIEMGIADPDRLAITGHSYGGYAVYSIISQTTRFKAAMAHAGASDLFSNYGQFFTENRYNGSDTYAYWFQWAESTQGALGAPPWEDPDRYIRNSPLAYVARVQTPILIVQGDQDFVPVQQGEEYFNAMVRLNKPARFLRYWGEGHYMGTPANRRDLSERMLEWLDHYLSPAKPAPGAN